MSKRSTQNDKVIILTKSDAVDYLLYAISIGTVTGTMLVAPNAVQALDKPLSKLLQELDEKQKRRKLSRMKSYLKTQGLVRDNYEHGLVLTKKALSRIEKINFDNMAIKTDFKWDCKWRMVMFDVPEQKKYERQKFTDKIKDLGLQLLQQSVWIHPYPCRDELTLIASRYGIEDFVTYIETSHIDNEEKLIYRFKQTGVL